MYDNFKIYNLRTQTKKTFCRIYFVEKQKAERSWERCIIYFHQRGQHSGWIRQLIAPRGVVGAELVLRHDPQYFE